LPAEEGKQSHEALVLNSARRAYNEKDYAFAVERFREFLAKFGTSPDAVHAKLGLAMAILESGLTAEEDCQTAVAQLSEVVKSQDFPQRPIALYYLGAGHRALARIALARAGESKEKATEHLGAALKSFEAAATHLATAADALKEGLAPSEEGQPLSEKWEWVARAQCDQVEALLRAGKPQQALETAERSLANGVLKKSRSRDLAYYYHGFAAYRLSEAADASESSRHNALTKCIQSLSEIELTDDATIGQFAGHAQYLLARAQHQIGKHEEAVASYDKMIARYEQEKQQAVEALKDPEALKGKRAERARLEELVKSAPDHVMRAQFYRGDLFFEQSWSEKALEAFSAFVASYPASPLFPDAQLRRGISLWHLKRYPECIEALGKIAAEPSRLTDQAHLWIGKAHVAAGDPAKPDEYAKSLQTAAESFTKAGEILKALAATDAGAKKRLVEALLHLADTQILAKKYADAAANYQQMLSLGVTPKRSEELLYRQATALQLAGKYPESDALCLKFKESYPESNLLAQVLFRSAENAFFQASALAEQLPKETADREQQIKKAFIEAAGRYQAVVNRAGNIPELNLARLGLGASHYRAGDHGAANAALAEIPADEMKGKLAQAALLRSDCLLRLAPRSADNETALAKLNTDMDEAIKLLNAFLAGSPESPHRPQVLLKLGLCQQIKAENQLSAEEQAKGAKAAVGTYDAFLQQFGTHGLAAQVMIEKAKSLIAAGETDAGLAELHKFTQAPLNGSPLAPLALLREGIALRAAGKAEEAVTLLDQARKQYEESLLKGAEKQKEWAVLLHFQHGLAVKGTGKGPEAKALMEEFLKRYPDRPEAPEAGLRVGQAMLAEARALLEAAQTTLANPNASQDEQAAAKTKRQNAFRGIDSAAQYFDQVLAMKEKQPNSPVWPRVHYELAWCYRLRFQDHCEAELRMQRAEAAKLAARGQTAEAATKIPYHPSEAPMAKHYKAITEQWPDQPIAVDAQLELAEYLLRRERRELAMTHLTGALAKPGRKDLKPKIGFLLASCLAEEGKSEEALKHFEEVCADLENPLAPHAAFLAGEARLRLGTADKAAEKFQLFVDQAAFQAVEGLSDRGLLRLAAARGQLGDHAASQKACELMLSRFPKSPFIHHARFALGQALQAQDQLDAAIQTYTEVVTGTTDEVAARAQFQIGMCRLQNKLYSTAGFDFLKVFHTYDYPEWSAAALLKCAECSVADKNLDKAAKYLRRLLKEFPKSQQAEAAKERLSFIEAEEAKKAAEGN